MNKIEAIEKTVYNLENNVYEYRWSGVDSCNCGILARTLLGGKSVWDAGFTSTLPTGKGGSFSTHGVCMTTGMKLPEVFQVLQDAGFTHQDLYELEFLGNQKIDQRAGIECSFGEDGDVNIAHGKFSEKEYVIKYFKAWLEILKEEQPKAIIEKDTKGKVETPQPETPKPKETIRYVSVIIPETILKEQKEETIFN